MKTKNLEKEADDWYRFCTDHLSVGVVQACLENISPYQFWSIADHYLDLVRHLHVQIRLLGNFGLNGSVPWSTDSELGLFCKESVADICHFRYN